MAESGFVYLLLLRWGAEPMGGGNVSLNIVREIAETGVDLISIGALTYSVVAVDISLKIVR